MFDWFNGENIEIARNLVLSVGGVLALGLAFWRSVVVAGRQEKISQEQVKTSQEQVKTSQEQVKTSQSQLNLAEKGQRNDRYQKGAAMLGSKLMSEREAGIFSLSNLAQEDLENFYFIVQKVLSQFVRETTQRKKEEWESKSKREIGSGNKFPKAEGDVTTAIHELAIINKKRCALRTNDPNAEGVSASVDLSNVCLCGYVFSKIDLTGFDFSGADLIDVWFRMCVLDGVKFDLCNCKNTKFLGFYRYAPVGSVITTNAPIKNATFLQTDLTNAAFENVVLRQTIFDSADMYRTKIYRSDLGNTRFRNIVPEGSGETILFENVVNRVGAKISSGLLTDCKTDDKGAWLREVEAEERVAKNTVAEDILGDDEN